MKDAALIQDLMGETDKGIRRVSAMALRFIIDVCHPVMAAK